MAPVVYLLPHSILIHPRSANSIQNRLCLTFTLPYEVDGDIALE
jgi:hypothetical protein